MFLATTALSEFWEKDQEILFLGSWCCRYDRRTEWRHLRYRVMPSLWNDREQFYEAAWYLDACSERMLDRLADYLNGVHRVSWSRRSWRILISPWLIRYLHAVYDRYLHLREAFRHHPDIRTLVLDPQAFQIPRDTSHAATLLGIDPYNLQVFSQLLEGMGHAFPQRMFEQEGTAPSDGNATAGHRGALVEFATQGLRSITNAVLWLRHDLSQVALCEAFDPRRLGWALAWHSRFRALPVELRPTWPFAIPPAVFDSRRTDLARLSAHDGFERLVMTSLPWNFPRVYLEGYALGRAEALRMMARMPQTITSATGWYFHEPFKFVAAEAAQQGRRLVAVQHGGGYGLFRFYPEELHESRVSDAFLVWGWAGEQSANCRNLPSPRLSQLKPQARPSDVDASRKSTVLFVVTAHPRYLYKFNSTPVGSQWEDYFAWQAAFLSALPDRLRQALLLRPYVEEYGEGTVARLIDRFGALRCDRARPFHVLLTEARVAVIDHLSTVGLEALVAEVPTVLFWDPKRWELRPEAEEDVARLRRVGILWDSPEAAATHVAAVYQDPWSWWNDQMVQQARRLFTDRYALTTPAWITRWTQGLVEEGEGRPLQMDTAGSAPVPAAHDVSADLERQVVSAGEGGDRLRLRHRFSSLGSPARGGRGG